MPEHHAWRRAPATPALTRQRRHGACVATLASLVLSTGAAWAAGADADARQTPTLAHRVQPGDTLEALSRHYLGDARLWPALARRNHVDEPRRLQPGSVLHISLDLLPLGSAEVLAVHGDARLGLPQAQAAVPAQAGQAVPEGARVHAGPASFISVRLADGTVVRVQADTEVQLEQLRRRGRAGDAQSVLQLHRGSVEPSVPPRPNGERRFEIRTPTASTAVRGTRFTVSVDADGRTLAAVTEGTLAVDSRVAAQHTGAPDALVAAGHGVAVSPNTGLGAVRALLAPPDLRAVPATLTEADFLRLSLGTVPGAVAYRVQVAKDAAFTDVVRSVTAPTSQVRMPAVPDGAYHVAARAIDGEGLPGRLAQRAVTVKAHPVAPLLQTPGDGATLARAQGELRCTPVAGAARYRMQVAGDAGFDAPVLDEVRQERCTLSTAALAPGRYRWRAASVRVLADGTLDAGPFGASQAFVVAEQPSTVRASAITAREADARLHLAWPGDTGQRFRIQVSSTPDFGAVLFDETLDAPAWTAPAGLAPGAYHLRIQAFDPSGLQSDFSTPRAFEVAAPVRSSFGLPVGASDGRPLALP